MKEKINERTAGILRCAQKKLRTLRLFGWQTVRYTQTLMKQRSRAAAREASSLLGYIERSINPVPLENELKYRFRTFAYLLEPSVLYLSGKPTSFFSTKTDLHLGWIYALGKKNTEHLLEMYLNISEMTGNTDQSLALWIKFLMRKGFERADADSITVTLSPSVRKQYDNTAGLEDGCIIEIESHPWMYGSDLAASGMLKR